MTGNADTPQDLTERAVDSLSACPDPRLRTLLQNLVRTLHGFAVDNELTEAEWIAGLQFLTDVGRTCTDRRQEFILLSDTLGLSMLVNLINHRAGDAATESRCSDLHTSRTPLARERRCDR